MDPASIDFVPAWERPIRIPAEVPLTHAEPPVAIAGGSGRWTLEFVLSRDVPAGAPLKLQILYHRNNRANFFDPEQDRALRPEFLRAETDAGAALELNDDGSGLVGIVVPDGGLPKGCKITVRIGEGCDIRTTTHRTLDKFFLLYVAEEGAGPATTPSGRHQIVAACTLHILGGAIHHLRAYAPSQSAPGRKLAILVRPEDEYSNLSCEFPGDLQVSCGGQELPAEIERVEGSTCVRMHLSLPGEGVWRLVVRAPRRGIEAVANPTICKAGPAGRNVFWGMIHGHTEMSDGTGTLDHYFGQMRDEAALDFAAPGDHDHVYETSDEMWRLTCRKVRRWNEPGRFVVFLGYEWAKWRQNGDGDRNVYYLHDDRPMYRSDNGHYPTPGELFAELERAGETAIVIPHHTGHAGNWCDFKDHGPPRERLVEIFQCRGSYECSQADGNPVPERGKEPPRAVGYVRRALAMGWRVGFTAGGDDHTGHAGTDFPLNEGGAGRSRYKAGLMSVQAAELTREAIWQAMWDRRVVATTGPRMLLDFRLGGRPMGSELSVADEPGLAAARDIDVEFHGTADVERIDFIRNNEVVHVERPDGADCRLTWSDATALDDVLLPAGPFCDHPFAFYYVRAVQKDGEVAWASPIWIDP